MAVVKIELTVTKYPTKVLKFLANQDQFVARILFHYLRLARKTALVELKRALPKRTGQLKRSWRTGRKSAHSFVVSNTAYHARPLKFKSQIQGASKPQELLHKLIKKHHNRNIQAAYDMAIKDFGL